MKRKDASGNFLFAFFFFSPTNLTYSEVLQEIFVEICGSVEMNTCVLFVHMSVFWRNRMNTCSFFGRLAGGCGDVRGYKLSRSGVFQLVLRRSAHVFMSSARTCFRNVPPQVPTNIQIAQQEQTLKASPRLLSPSLLISRAGLLPPNHHQPAGTSPGTAGSGTHQAGPRRSGPARPGVPLLVIFSP